MGIKMDHKSDPMSDNALYDISNDQRSEAYSMLRACCVSGVWKEDVEATDVAIAAVVALSFRDVSHNLAMSGDPPQQKLM
jgi:hypothetical protein